MTTIKVALIGAQGSGKTSLVRQFVNHEFSDDQAPTITREIYFLPTFFHEDIYELQIIDLPALEKFPRGSLDEWNLYQHLSRQSSTSFVPPDSPAKRYLSLRLVNAFVFVVDASQLESSFAYAAKMREQILNVKPSASTSMILVLNKQDLADDEGSAQQKHLKECMNTARKHWKCPIVECSAKHNWRVDIVFKEVVRLVGSSVALPAAHEPVAIALGQQFQEIITVGGNGYALSAAHKPSDADEKRHCIVQ